MPIACKALAQARSTAISQGRRRRSNANERWNASNCLSGSRSKRPPHRRSSFRWGCAVISFRFQLGDDVDERTSSRVAFSFGFGTDGDGQGEKIDDAFGMFGIVAAHNEAG